MTEHWHDVGAGIVENSGWSGYAPVAPTAAGSRPAFGPTTAPRVGSGQIAIVILARFEPSRLLGPWCSKRVWSRTSTHTINFIRVLARRSAPDVHAPRLWFDDDGEHGLPEAGLGVVVRMTAYRKWISIVIAQHLLQRLQVRASTWQVQQLVNPPLPVVRLNEFGELCVNGQKLRVPAMVGAVAMARLAPLPATPARS